MVNRSVWLPEMMRFARAGYVVASIEYRTSNEAIFPAQLIDVKSAVRFLRAHAKEFCVAPDRICAMGESAGGTMASLLGVTGDQKEFGQGDHLDQSSAVQGVVDYCGVVDLSDASAERDRMSAATNQSNDVPYFAFEEFLGVGYGKAEAEKASAVRYISEKTPPFMILHGTKDTVVPIAQSEKLYCEIWRHEWEVMQNKALDQAGRTERVDMRSFKRQGIETAPQVHLGPAAFALEKKGIRTGLGEHNKAVKIINSLFAAIKRGMKTFADWLKEINAVISDHEKIENPSAFPLYEVLFAYYDLRKRERLHWSISARNKAGAKDLPQPHPNDTQ